MKVLDIGAGFQVNKEATDAIDVEDPRQVVKGFKKPKHIEKYYVADICTPPKEMTGKYDKIVSNAAFGVGIWGKQCSRAIKKITTPDAKAEIEVDLSFAGNALQTLKDAGFIVQDIKMLEKPAWRADDGDIIGTVIIKAQKGVELSPIEKEIGSQFPVVFSLPKRKMLTVSPKTRRRTKRRKKASSSLTKVK